MALLLLRLMPVLRTKQCVDGEQCLLRLLLLGEPVNTAGVGTRQGGMERWNLVWKRQCVGT